VFDDGRPYAELQFESQLHLSCAGASASNRSSWNAPVSWATGALGPSLIEGSVAGVGNRGKVAAKCLRLKAAGGAEFRSRVVEQVCRFFFFFFWMRSIGARAYGALPAWISRGGAQPQGKPIAGDPGEAVAARAFEQCSFSGCCNTNPLKGGGAMVE